jgi:tetratricopeptide (TPR) repeat protein
MGLRIGVGVFLCLTVAFAQKSKKKAKESEASDRDSFSWRAAASPYVKGVVYFSQGLIEEALPYFLGALEKAPHSAGIHYYLAQIAYAQRDYPRMLTHAEKA